MLVIAALTCGLTVYLFVVIPKGFFPQQDNGRLNGGVVASQDISFQAMREKVTQLAAIVQADPGGRHRHRLHRRGRRRGTTVNTARMFVALKPQKERDATADQIIARLRPKLARVTGPPSTCRRSRTSGSAAASATPSTSTRSRRTASRI